MEEDDKPKKFPMLPAFVAHSVAAICWFVYPKTNGDPCYAESHMDGTWTTCGGALMAVAVFALLPRSAYALLTCKGKPFLPAMLALVVLVLVLAVAQDVPFGVGTAHQKAFAKFACKEAEIACPEKKAHKPKKDALPDDWEEAPDDRAGGGKAALELEAAPPAAALEVAIAWGGVQLGHEWQHPPAPRAESPAESPAAQHPETAAQPEAPPSPRRTQTWAVSAGGQGVLAADAGASLVQHEEDHAAASTRGEKGSPDGEKEKPKTKKEKYAAIATPLDINAFYEAGTKQKGNAKKYIECRTKNLPGKANIKTRVQLEKAMKLDDGAWASGIVCCVLGGLAALMWPCLHAQLEFDEDESEAWGQMAQWGQMGQMPQWGTQQTLQSQPTGGMPMGMPAMAPAPLGKGGGGKGGAGGWDGAWGESWDEHAEAPHPKAKAKAKAGAKAKAKAGAKAKAKAKAAPGGKGGGEERRYDQGEGPYTYAEFQEVYGPQTDAYWQAGTPA